MFSFMILYYLQYSKYKAFILFTPRSSQGQLPKEHRWRDSAGLARAHHSQLFLYLWLASQWQPSCATLGFTSVVLSTERDPRVVALKGSHHVAQHRVLRTTIWWGRLADCWNLTQSYNINSNLWNLYPTLNLSHSSITLTLTWGNLMYMV